MKVKLNWERINNTELLALAHIVKAKLLAVEVTQNHVDTDIAEQATKLLCRAMALNRQYDMAILYEAGAMQSAKYAIQTAVLHTRIVDIIAENKIA
jgi:hypothetical protein